MKTILGLSITLFFLLGSVAWATPDYMGYGNWVQKNQQNIEKLTKKCGAGKTYNKNACYSLARLTFKAQCKFNVNPEACKELKNLKKTFNK